MPLGEDRLRVKLLLGLCLFPLLSAQAGILRLHPHRESSVELGKGSPRQGVSSPSPVAAGP